MTAPEKEYFTLTEIMKRWERSKIDDVTLLDYARRDILMYSVYLRDIGSHKREIIEPNGEIRTTTTTKMQFIFPSYTYQPIRYLKASDARRVLEAQDGEKVAVSVLYSSRERNKKSGTGYPQPHYFESNDLLVIREERDQFEKEYKLKIGSKTDAAWKWLTDANNQKALTLIGGVITAISVGVWQLYVRLIN